MIGPMFFFHFFPWFFLVLKLLDYFCYYMFFWNSCFINYLFWSGSKPFRLAVFAVFEGYTHMQRAMPTTVGTWLDSFAQGWKDATNVLEGACLGRTLWSKVGQFWASKRCALDLPPAPRNFRKIYPKFH